MSLKQEFSPLSFSQFRDSFETTDESYEIFAQKKGTYMSTMIFIQCLGIWIPSEVQIHSQESLA